MMSLRSSASGMIDAAAAAGLSAGLTFASTVVLARTLGSNEFGTWVPFMMLQVLVQSLFFGPLALEVFRCARRGTYPSASVRFAVTLSVVPFVLAIFFSSSSGFGRLESPGLAFLYLSVGIQQGVASFGQQTLLAHGHRFIGAIVLSFGNLTRLVGVWIFQDNPGGAMWVATCAALVVVVGLLLAANKSLKLKPVNVEKGALYDAGRWAPLVWMQQASDRWALAILQAPSVVGTYALHLQVCGPFAVLADTLVQYRVGESSDNDHLKWLRRSILPFAALAFCYGMSGSIWGGGVVARMFGPTFVFDGRLFSVLVALTCCSSLAGIGATALVLSSQSGAVLRIRVVLGASNVLGTIPAAALGPMTLALNNLAFAIIQVVWMIIYTRRLTENRGKLLLTGDQLVLLDPYAKPASA